MNNSGSFTNTGGNNTNFGSANKSRKLRNILKKKLVHKLKI